MPRTLPTPPPAGADHVPGWAALVEEALHDGIISIDQAERLRALAVRGGASAPPRPAPTGGRARAYVAEALGYVGAALVLVAGLVIADQFWADLAPWAHTVLLGTLAVALVAAGAAVRGEVGTPTGRLGSFLWVLGVVAIGGTLAVVTDELAGLEDAAMAVATFGPTTVLAALLWSRRRRALQELATALGTMMTGVSALAWVDVDTVEDWGGLLVWSLGVAWLLLARAGRIHPVRTGQAVGATAALLGPWATSGATGGWGLVVGLATAATLVAASVLVRETVLLGLGVLGLFLYVPRLVFQYFGEQLGAPVALLASGAVLLGVALWIARVRRDETER